MPLHSRASRWRHRRLGWLLVAGSIAAALTPTAAPADPPPAAVAQYVEMVPTSTGSKAPSAAAGRTAVLTTRAATALEEEPRVVADALEEVATSDRYGAPTESPSPGRPRGGRPKSEAPVTAESELGAENDPQFAAAAAAAISRDFATVRVAAVVAFLGLVIAFLVASSLRGRRSYPAR